MRAKPASGYSDICSRASNGNKCGVQGLPMPGRPLSEAVQQMITTSVQMEAIRRREEVRPRP